MKKIIVKLTIVLCVLLGCCQGAGAREVHGCQPHDSLSVIRDYTFFLTGPTVMPPDGGSLHLIAESGIDPHDEGIEPTFFPMPLINAAMWELNSGEADGWDGGFSCEAWEDEVDGYLHILVKAGPNLSSQTRTATFPFYDNSRLHITLSQAGGGHIVDKALSFTETDNGVRVILPETQIDVIYEFSYDGNGVSYCVGKGQNDTLCAPSGSGRYVLMASYMQSEELWEDRTLASGIMRGGVFLNVSEEKNWILSLSYDTDSTGQRRTVSDVAYYDGLGYPEQDVLVRASGSGLKDLVTPHGLDHLLREPDSFLPYAVTGDGACQENALAAQRLFHSDTCAAAHTTLEASSAGRVVWTRKPGQDYAQGNKRVSYDYGTNTAGSVYILTVAADGSFSVNGYYPAGSLVRTRVTDEDGGAVETYADLSGQLVLERRQISASEWAETYYAYDDLGRLRRVISPEGSAMLENNTTYTAPDDLFAEFPDEPMQRRSYAYEYDGRGLMTKKWIPGVEVQTFTYNDAGQLVSSQDGNQRTGGKHRTYMYDGLDRLVEEYLKAGNDSTLLRQYVYDSYPSGMTSDLAFSAITGVTSVGGVSLKDNRTTGLLCYEKVNVLGTANHVERAHYYDQYGNVIQTVEKYPGGGVLRTSSRYSLGGNVLATDCRYTKNNTTYTLAGNNTYDTRGRILSATSTLNGSTTMSAAYAYDDLGRLVKTTYGNGVTDSLSYDLRGWRTVQTVKKGNTDIFSSVLRYNTAGYGANACWNGNIASQGWAHGNAVQQNQGYLYDRMSRLTRVENGDVQGWPYAQEYVFDRNTNLTVKYDLDEDDEEVDMDEFPVEGNQCTDYYNYDANGNLTSSSDGWTVTYNLLNLPASATKGTGADALVSSWTYLADGTKIGAHHSWLEEADPFIGPGFPEEPAPEPGPGGSGVVPSGPNALQDPMYAIVVKDYIYAGPFRLVQEMFPASITLESVATVGGRIVKNGNNLQLRYYITDHLGSTRVVLNNDGTVMEHYDYHPYGEIVPVSVASSGNTDYLYTGKESQQSLFGINWYDSGARFQTTDGIFTGIDPLAEKYYHISPYAYCAGNPVNVVDPTGMGLFRDEDGNYMYLFDDEYEEDTYKDENGKTWQRVKSCFWVSPTGQSVQMYDSGVNIGPLKTYPKIPEAFTQDQIEQFERFKSGYNSFGSLFLSMGSSYVYNPNTGKWMGMNLKQYAFSFNGNGITGGRNTFARSFSKFLKRGASILGAMNIYNEGKKMLNSNDSMDRMNHGIEAMMGAVGFIPYAGPFISIGWELFGRQAFNAHVEFIVKPQLEETGHYHPDFD